MRSLLAIVFLIVPLMAPVAGQDVPPDASDRLLVLDLRNAKPGTYPIVVLVAPNGVVSWKQPTIVDVGGGGGGGAPLPPTTPKPPFQPPLTGLAADAAKWTKDGVNHDGWQAQALKLAAAYESVAADIEAGKIKQMVEIPVAQLAANVAAIGQEGRAQWSGVINQFADYLTQQFMSGKIRTVGDHAPLWRQFAAGLRGAAK